MAIEILGLKPGEKVLVPTYHCPTMISPVTALNALPVFYPIDVNGMAQMEWLRRQPLAGVRAIFAVHYFGLPQSMRVLREWCNEYGIVLVEDCAHSLFGICDGRAIGTWGDMSIGSLTKFFPVPEGGCLLLKAATAPVSPLRKPTAFEQVKALLDIVHFAAEHRRLVGLNSLLLGAFFVRKIFKRKQPAAKFQPDNAQAGQEEAMDGFTLDVALSHRALTWSSAWIARCMPRARIVEQRCRHFKELARLLSGVDGLRPLFVQLPHGAAPYVFPLWVDSPDPGYSQLRAAGVPVSRWDRLWPDIPHITGDLGPTWSHHVLQLACHQDLTDDEVRTIAATVLSIYRATNSTPASRPSAKA